ncbi:MAG: hypothetical protein ACOX6T_16380 [Myxococcales bacterium]
MSRRAALLGLLLASCGACEQLAGPEAQIARTLALLGESGARFEVPGGEVELVKARFDRVLVKPEEGQFVAVATVDAEARLAGARVSYLGRERIGFEQVDGQWRPAGAALPGLQEILSVMLRRAEAAERGDAAALGALVAQRWSDSDLAREELMRRLEQLAPAPAGRAEAWYVRNERGDAEVLEERRGPGGELIRRRFKLVREGPHLRISEGLR